MRTAVTPTEDIANHKDQLVFDIGLNNGEDTAYYLHLGYRVLGVEANPLLAAQCVRRFESEVRRGRVEIANVGVWSAPGEFTFYRNLSDDGASSFLQERAPADRAKCEPMTIPCVTTRQLIAKYGQPFFIKIDIEGADFRALQSLDPAIAPCYISLELNYSDPIGERLLELGYSAFKFVNGETYLPTPPVFDHQLGWRLLRKAGRMAPFIRNGIARLPLRFRPNAEYDPPGKYSPDDYPPGRRSGPFGEQACGSWMEPSVALRWWGKLRENHRRAGLQNAIWWDVHARHSSAAPCGPVA